MSDLDCVPDWPEELLSEALDQVRTCVEALSVDDLTHITLTLSKYDARLPFARPLVDALTKLAEVRFHSKYPEA